MLKVFFSKLNLLQKYLVHLIFQVLNRQFSTPGRLFGTQIMSFCALLVNPDTTKMQKTLSKDKYSGFQTSIHRNYHFEFMYHKFNRQLFTWAGIFSWRFNNFVPSVGFLIAQKSEKMHYLITSPLFQNHFSQKVLEWPLPTRSQSAVSFTYAGQSIKKDGYSLFYGIVVFEKGLKWCYNWHILIFKFIFYNTICFTPPGNVSITNALLDKKFSK